VRHLIALIVLGPLFYLQGKYVRRVTPELPEADGPRSGHSGQGGRLDLVILGDSAAAGVGVAKQSQALSGQLVQSLSATFTIQWSLEATTGHTCADMIARVNAWVPQQRDVVVVSVGVNDVTAMTSLRAWQENIAHLIALLDDKCAGPTIYFSSVPPMHAFPALPQPLRAWLGARAAQLNQALRQLTLDHDRCRFVETPFALTADYIAADGFHPGAAAYQLWGQSVAARITEDVLRT